MTIQYIFISMFMLRQTCFKSNVAVNFKLLKKVKDEKWISQPLEIESCGIVGDARELARPSAYASIIFHSLGNWTRVTMQ